MSVDYLVDETLMRTENNYLLDPETGLPNPDLTNRSEQALAEVAAALNRNSEVLSGAQLEQVARWVKRLKICKKGRMAGSRNDFFATLELLRKSAEQKKLQKKTYWKLLATWAVGLVFAIILLSLAIVNWSDADIGWGWQLALGVVLIFAWGGTSMLAEEALNLAKEQDRRYALASLRKALTVYELNEAGLFTYIPNTRYDEPGFDGKKAMRLIRTDVERLTDALYNDPEDWLMDAEYPWREGASKD